MTFEEVLLILSNLLKIAASPQGLQIIGKILGPSLPDITAAAAALKDAPPTHLADNMPEGK